MEFWGIEVKPGQTVKCEPGNERVLHLSQASLGESKKVKGSDNVQVFVKINDQKIVIGNLSPEKCAQIQCDLVFEKEFELSHGSKSTSVFFVGYRSVYHGYESEDFDDSSSEDDLEIAEKLNGKPFKKEHGKPISEKAGAAKHDSEATKAKEKIVISKKLQVKASTKGEDKDEDDSDDDDDEDFEDSDDDDEDMIGAPGENSEEDEGDSSEEEATPEKVETGKKRKPGSSQTPIPDKKTKVVTPAHIQKTGGDGKKGGHVHVATPYPSKQGGKPQPTPKSGGSVTCKACSRNFNTENALQAHNKAKHGAAK